MDHRRGGGGRLIHPRLRSIVADVLGLDADDVGETTGPAEVKAWDSIRHLQLVLALESEFSVLFAPEEIPTLTSAGRLQRALAARGVL